MTAEEYARMGGVIYYHGTLTSVHANHTVDSLDHYIQTGGESLRVLRSNLQFIPGCETRVVDGSLCSLSEEDSLALNCSENERAAGTVVVAASGSDASCSPYFLAIIIIGSVVCGFLLEIMISRVYRRCRRQTGCRRSLSKQSIVHYMNGTAADGSGRVSISKVSTSNR